MAKFLKQHAGSLLLSVLLHVALMGMLAVTVSFSKPPQRAKRLAIEATLVDPATMPEERRRQEELRQEREATAQRERERQQELIAKREAEELEQRQAEEAKQRKAAEDKRKADEAVKKKAAEDKRKAEEAAKKKAAEDKRKAEEAAKKKAAEEKRKQEEAAERKRQQEQARQEQLLREELAREEELEALRSGPLMNRYLRDITAQIQRNWILPMSAQPGVECLLRVIQTRSGAVVDAQVEECNGDSAVVRSLEAAALRASPLPEPSDPRLFDRELLITFRQ